MRLRGADTVQLKSNNVRRSELEFQAQGSQRFQRGETRTAALRRCAKLTGHQQFPLRLEPFEKYRVWKKIFVDFSGRFGVICLLMGKVLPGDDPEGRMHGENTKHAQDAQRSVEGSASLLQPH